MSEEQFTALLAKLKVDAELREKLQDTADLDEFLSMVNEAGFDIKNADWLKYQAGKLNQLTDADLESVAGAKGVPADFTAQWTDQCLCR